MWSLTRPRPTQNCLEWCKALQTVETYSLERWISVHYLAVWQMNLGLADARRTLPTGMHRANSKVWWRWNNGLVLFFSGFGLCPLVPVKGNVNSIARHFRQLYAFNFVATAWGRPLPAPAWLWPCAQSEIHKDVVWWIWCEGPPVACTEPWPQPH